MRLSSLLVPLLLLGVLVIAGYAMFGRSFTLGGGLGLGLGVGGLVALVVLVAALFRVRR